MKIVDSFGKQAISLKSETKNMKDVVSDESHILVKLAYRHDLPEV